MRGNFYGNAGDAYYSPQDNRIYLDINLVDERSKVLGFNTDITALLHESGHWLDFNMLGNGQTVRSQLPELRKYLEKDTINYVNNLIKPKNPVKSIADVTRLDWDERIAICRDLEKDDCLKNGVSDIYDGLTKHLINNGYGHHKKKGQKEYWQGDNLEIETIAHFFEVLGVGGQKKAILKEYFPTAFEYFETFIKGVI